MVLVSSYTLPDAFYSILGLTNLISCSEKTNPVLLAENPPLDLPRSMGYKNVMANYLADSKNLKCNIAVSLRTK